jgi:murein DD-endopeptidase MepM/ murein hydrolase activator NlpD
MMSEFDKIKLQELRDELSLKLKQFREASRALRTGLDPIDKVALEAKRDQLEGNIRHIEAEIKQLEEKTDTHNTTPFTEQPATTTQIDPDNRASPGSTFAASDQPALPTSNAPRQQKRTKKLFIAGLVLSICASVVALAYVATTPPEQVTVTATLAQTTVANMNTQEATHQTDVALPTSSDCPDLGPFWLRPPVKPVRITQSFGQSPETFMQYGLPGHEGVDFAAVEGQPVWAAQRGIVTEAVNEDDGHPYGRRVYITHDWQDKQFRTLYANLDSVIVKEGDEVLGGQLIGYAGSTGSSNGPHLHLTLKEVGATARGETLYPYDIIDPSPFFSTVFDEVIKLRDVTIPTGATVKPNESFTKTWNLLNTGTTAWTDEYTIAHISGESFGLKVGVSLPLTNSGERTDASISLVAPSQPGNYSGVFMLHNAEGVAFPCQLDVQVNVENSERG